MQFLRHSDLDIGVAGFDGKAVIEAKLFGALTKASGHFEVEEGNGIIIHVFLTAFLLEANAVRDTTSALHYFVNHVVADRAILETYDVDHAVSLHCILGCQFLIKELGFTQLGGFFGLPKSNVGESVSDDYTK